MAKDFPQGTVHQAAADLEGTIRSDPGIFELWKRLTPLGRSEFICWVEDLKQPATRLRRICRTGEELLKGKKRPYCWMGCIHRTDKTPSPWQQAVLINPKSPRAQRAARAADRRPDKTVSLGRLSSMPPKG